MHIRLVISYFINILQFSNIKIHIIKTSSKNLKKKHKSDLCKSCENCIFLFHSRVLRFPKVSYPNKLPLPFLRACMMSSYMGSFVEGATDT